MLTGGFIYCTLTGNISDGYEHCVNKVGINAIGSYLSGSNWVDSRAT
ncbi:hypothetical protein XBI1_3080080 [Xenorhabdus bovienii str. Intermedium]|uniref:Uncharacterized protein n=1 Tax=Xenorhabdus bovienii str. Intermedium TaxID=1379677 RepID=A0A077QPU6_XENBV|nr:hypothetical protein XBI1_3080080 [Xenorhabdus bovienii str. Intermedium]